jgi:hypothetical protein
VLWGKIRTGHIVRSGRDPARGARPRLTLGTLSGKTLKEPALTGSQQEQRRKGNDHYAADHCARERVREGVEGRESKGGRRIRH